MKKRVFSEQGKWWKGNLHTHSTESDGALSPEEVYEIYQSAGYDFMALTDHRICSKETKYKDMLILPGVEWDTGDNSHSPVFHIIGIGMTKEPDLEFRGNYTPEAIVQSLRAADALTFLAHPAWSVMNPKDISKIKKVDGVEIYNSVSTIPWNCDRADSSYYFDLWASEGIYMKATAADDAHHYNGDQTKSFIMVKALECTTEAIKKAIRDGNFYASQGPRFEQIEVGENTVHVTCSKDVTKIIFYSNTAWASERYQEITDGTATYSIHPLDRFVRIECRDDKGNKAFSSPIELTPSR